MFIFQMNKHVIYRKDIKMNLRQILKANPFVKRLGKR